MNCCKMKPLVSTALLILSLCCFGQGESRLALVIGNSDYSITPLQNPVNDARLVAKTLQELGFKVLVHENLETRREFANAIRVFGEMRSNYDVGFVYYAGHGMQVNAENYLLPTKESFESEYDVIDFGISAQSILRYLETSSDQVNVLILDACRNNGFEHNINPSRALNQGGGLAKISPPAGSLVAYSTEAGKTAKDGERENSIYTSSLCRNMLKTNTSLDQVFRNVRAEVMEATGNTQRPIEASLLTGNAFYLKTGEMSPEALENLFQKAESQYSSALDAIQDDDSGARRLKANEDFIEVLTLLEENEHAFWKLEREQILSILVELQWSYSIQADLRSNSDIATDKAANRLRKEQCQNLAFEYCDRISQTCLNWGVKPGIENKLLRSAYSKAELAYLELALRWRPEKINPTELTSRARTLVSFNENTWGRQHTWTAYSYWVLGWCLERMGNYELAVKHWNTSSLIFEKTNNKDLRELESYSYSQFPFKIWYVQKDVLDETHYLVNVFDEKTGVLNPNLVDSVRNVINSIYELKTADLPGRVAELVDFALLTGPDSATSAQILHTASGILHRFLVGIGSEHVELRHSFRLREQEYEWRNRSFAFTTAATFKDSIIFMINRAESIESLTTSSEFAAMKTATSTKKLEQDWSQLRQEVHHHLIQRLNSKNLHGHEDTLEDKNDLILFLFGNIGAFARHGGINDAQVENLSEMIFDAEPFFIEAMKVSIINESLDVPWYAKSEMLRRYLFGCVQAQNESLLERLPAIDNQVEMYNAFFSSEATD